MNLALKEQFDNEKINFAFPTQTLYLKQDSNWSLAQPNRGGDVKLMARLTNKKPAADLHHADGKSGKKIYFFMASAVCTVMPYFFKTVCWKSGVPSWP